MNSGTASSGKSVAPSYMTSAVFGSIVGPCMIQIAPTATTPSATAIGTLSMTRPIMPSSIALTAIFTVR